jgi:hypothetical protein
MGDGERGLSVTTSQIPDPPSSTHSHSPRIRQPHRAGQTWKPSLTKMTNRASASRKPPLPPKASERSSSMASAGPAVPRPTQPRYRERGGAKFFFCVGLYRNPARLTCLHFLRRGETEAHAHQT